MLMEIRSAAVDPQKRLKAIAANEKNRERELASRSDEFQTELSGFVVGKKLRMTGGAEEAERVRQKKNELTLKAMFTGSSSTGSMTASAGEQERREREAWERERRDGRVGDRVATSVYVGRAIYFVSRRHRGCASAVDSRGVE